MLELCARRENEPAKREGTLNRGSTGVKLQPISWIYVCCVLTISLERRNISLDSFFKNPRATPPTLTLWDEHTSIAQCSTKCCVKRPARAQIKRRFFFFWLREVGWCHALALSRSVSLRVEGKMALNATTSLQNKLFSLPTDKSTSLSTHGSHSDTQSSPQRLLWNDK